MTTAYKRAANFVLGTSRVRIEFEAKPAQALRNPQALTVDLTPVPADAVEVSFVGDIAGSSGQCQDDIRMAAEALSEPPAAVIAVLDLWDRWHLNGLKPGSRAQNEALANLEGGDAAFPHREEYLAARGLNPDPSGYKFGSAWLYEPLPPALLLEVDNALDLVDGQRFNDGDIDFDLLGEADFSSADDIIDSRDVIKRIEELEGAFEAAGLDVAKLDPTSPDYGAQGLDDDHPAHDFAAELRALKALEDEAEGYAGDWRYGAALIRHDHFVEYAEQLAEDIGAVNRDSRWPNDCIDWKKAAEELKADYTSVDFDGVEYWIR